MQSANMSRLSAPELNIEGRKYVLFPSTLGVGYRSKVRAGIRKDTNERVAVKIVEKSSRESVNDRARREVELLKKLQGHPNIIKLIDAHEDEHCIYLVLERHEQTVLEYIERSGGKLSPSRAAQILRQLVNALHYAQSFHIAHMDLKLENVMLNSNGDAVLIDFGFAEEIEPGRKLTVGRGSFRYVPPEIAGYEEFEPAKADAWALGVLLYAMCAGRLPFSGDEENVPRLFRHIRTGKYAMPTSFSDELRDLVSGLLQVDPARRLTLDRVAAHPFLSQQSPLRTSMGGRSALSGSCSNLVLRMSGTMLVPAGAAATIGTA